VHRIDGVDEVRPPMPWFMLREILAQHGVSMCCCPEP